MVPRPLAPARAMISRTYTDVIQPCSPCNKFELSPVPYLILKWPVNPELELLSSCNKTGSAEKKSQVLQL